MPKVIAVIGKKGSGKSQVLEELIESLAQRGRRVGVIKRLAKDDIEIDQPGKDTFRYRMRGAGTVVLAGRKRLALFRDLQSELSLEALLVPFENFDLVFMEDYFTESIPTLEIYQEDVAEKPYYLSIKSVFAVCTHAPVSTELPVFYFQQIPLLVNFLEKKFFESSGASKKVSCA